MKTLLAATAALALLAANCAAEMRTFTSKNGKTLEAEIVSATEKEVELKTAADKTYKIPLSSLSDKDQLEIGIWREEQQKKKALAGVTLGDLFKSQGVTAVSIRSDDGFMFIEASLNGKTAVFLLEPRTEPTLLDEPAVAKLGLEMKAAAGNLQGAKGQVEVTSFKFGETDLGTTQVPVVAFDNMAASLRPKLDGILGHAFLQKNRALLDYAEMKLWLRPEK